MIVKTLTWFGLIPNLNKIIADFESRIAALEAAQD